VVVLKLFLSLGFCMIVGLDFMVSRQQCGKVLQWFVMPRVTGGNRTTVWFVNRLLMSLDPLQQSLPPATLWQQQQ